MSTKISSGLIALEMRERERELTVFLELKFLSTSLQYSNLPTRNRISSNRCNLRLSVVLGPERE